MRRLSILLLIAPLLAFQPGSPEKFDAKADGKADDTAAIQSILDGFSKPASTGVLTLPVGTYRITQTLVYRGNYGYGASVLGAIAAAGPSGTVLKWDGPVGGTVLELRGALGTTVERVAINGNGKAAIGVAVSYDTERQIGCSNVTLSHLHVGGVTDTAIAIGIRPDGSNDDRQVDAITLNRCLLVGHGKAGTSRYGINSGWGNVKNLSIRDCLVNGFQIGIRHGGSGFMIVDGFAGGNNTYSDFTGSTGNLDIRAGNSEGSTRLFMGATGANPGNVSISNFSWASSLTPGNGIIIEHQGVISLRGNHIWDNKWAGAVPIVRLNAIPGTAATLDSAANYFANATDWVPVVGQDGKYADKKLVRSFGDYGGPKGQISFLKVH